MLQQIPSYKYFIIAILLLLIILAVIYFIIKKQRVKPIDMEKVEDNNKKTSIEQVIEAMENTTEERPMTTFEQEQEDNAIISYQELVKAVSAKKANSEFKETVKVESAPKVELIPKEEIEDIIDDEVIDSKIIEDVIEEDNEKPVVKEKKFRNSEFISPVFGKEANTNDSFLKELKDLRKNL